MGFPVEQYLFKYCRRAFPGEKRITFESKKDRRRHRGISAKIKGVGPNLVPPYLKIQVVESS